MSQATRELRRLAHAERMLRQTIAAAARREICVCGHTRRNHTPVDPPAWLGVPAPPRGDYCRHEDDGFGARFVSDKCPCEHFEAAE